MPEFSCENTITIAAKPHPKSACPLQRSLGGGWGRRIRLGGSIEAHLAEQIIDPGPRDAEVNEHLRRWATLLVEQTE